MLEQRTVVALIDKESCFLSLQPIYMEFQSVFESYIVLATANDKTVFLSEVGLIGKGCLTLVINILHPITHHLNKLLSNALALEMYAHAMSLHNGGRTIDVDDESRNIIALAMHETICVVGWIIDNTDGAAHKKCRLQLGIPKGIVDGDIVEREDSHCNGTYLIMTHGNEIASGGHDSYHLALVNIFWLMLDGAGKHPRMESLQTFLLAFLQIYLLIHIFIH